MVSLTGGRGENILTSLEVGGGGAGAMSEARSLGGRAGGGRPGGGGEEQAGEEVERAAGGEGTVGEKKVRLGLVVIGVPSSSKSIGGVGVWSLCVLACCS